MNIIRLVEGLSLFLLAMIESSGDWDIMLMTLNIFPCVFWPFMYFLWRNVYFSKQKCPLPIFKLVTCFLLLICKIINRMV